MSTRKWTMIMTVLGVIFLLVAACNPNPQPPALTPIPTLASRQTQTLVPAAPAATAAPQSASAAQATADPALGVAVYQENCTTCHGVLGEGSDVGPALRNSKLVASGNQAVFKAIATGRSGTVMPSWSLAQGGSLGDDDINNIVAYMKTLQAVEPLPTLTPVPAEPTETPLPAGAPTPAPAHPSEEGGPGPAAALSGVSDHGQALFGRYCAACHGPQGALGRPNPGSDDGTVPTLNPIDETIADKDAQVFPRNLDLWLEHGSIPSGPSPQIKMPDFGDRKLLQPQQLADIIAYIISLNQ